MKNCSRVKAWKEKVLIPTYKVGSPEKNPMFLEKRVYQGSSGVVYPHPVIESVEDVKTDVEYTAYYLENDFLKIMILPELGGRIQRAYDKVANRDFVYYNQVIKPALVGLTGPWISGGIEFNWPQHHRPSTFSPIDCKIEELEDGSVTVWVNEIERMFRTKGMAGFTLYPDKAYLEIKGKLFNRTRFPQTFLWWANPAVKVNDHYQSIFPPDVYAVFDHGKRDVSSFPIATGSYYKVDYSPGTDISKYNTIPVPTSYMAINSGFDFVGCYEHDTQAGMLHVANHHISPGKKQWTWGNGHFGQTWDKNLTDEDGPYIELMAGVFTDNQPDFTFIQPNEIKTFEQYFLPFSKTGGVKNATKDIVLNVEFVNETIQLKIYATAYSDNIKIQVLHKNEKLAEYVRDVSPYDPFSEELIIDSVLNYDNIEIIVKDKLDRVLISYAHNLDVNSELPKPAAPALPPSEIEHIEELFLTGLHLEQYRHATYNPLDYYEEALKRDPNDVRCNNAVGLVYLKRGKFALAEQYFKRAILTLTSKNPNPGDGEPFYNLGITYKFQGDIPKAYFNFYKSTWSAAWQHSGFLELAKIEIKNNSWEIALKLLDQSLNYNFQNPIARHLKAVVLRNLNKTNEFNSFVEESLKLDPFNFGCLFERFSIGKLENKNSDAELEAFIDLMRNEDNNYLELSLDYYNAGLIDEAIDLLTVYTANISSTSPLIYYYLGHFYNLLNKQDQALFYFGKASAIHSFICFPNKLEDILILQDAIETNPKDHKAFYYLGNLWYDKRQYTDAIYNWQESIKHNKSFPTSYRNLSLAFFNKEKNPDKALLFMEKAFSLDESDARVLMELYQLYKIGGKVIEDRLTLLNKYEDLVSKRDDLYLERIVLLNNLGDYSNALNYLLSRKFHPWEGGEGKVIAQYLFSILELAKIDISEGKYNQAIQRLNDIDPYPENLGEGKLFGALENDRFYFLALSYSKLGDQEKAIHYFRLAASGEMEPVQAIYYNDPQPDNLFFQGLSYLKLNDSEKANKIFNNLIDFGMFHMDDLVSIDYFAVSLPDMLVFDIDINLRNKIHCTYLIALGYLGLMNTDKSNEYFGRVLQMDPNHQGAIRYAKMSSFI